MNIRDSKGRFLKGRVIDDEPIETRLKRIQSLQNSWKNRPDYIGDIKDQNPKVYNVWRGIMFTDKCKKQGISEEWKSYRNFYNDVISTYEKGKLFRRLDTSKPYCKENFIWVTKEESSLLLKENSVTIEYEGERLSIKQWADKLNVSTYGIKNRYYKRDKFNYSIREILYGKDKKRNSKQVKDATVNNIRSKASKMISSYRIRDIKNKTTICDIDIDWMIDNIISKSCVYCGDTHRIGCDRVDNTKGHTKDNVQPCCYECNVARGNNFTVQEMLIIGEAIRRVKKERTNR